MPRLAIALGSVLIAGACGATNDARLIKPSPPTATITQGNDTTLGAGIATGEGAVAKGRVRGNDEIPWPWGPNDTLFDGAVDSKYRLLLVRERDRVSDTVRLRVRLLERIAAGPTREIAMFPAGFTFGYDVLRADSTSMVLSRSDTDHGLTVSLKLFLDPVSKKMIKQVEFSSEVAFDSIPGQELAAALGVPDALIRELKASDPRPAPDEPWDKYLPQVLKDHRMPSSSYADFAFARPERVRNGYGPESEIGEVPGPFHIEGDRIWFGKTFYDGEGSSGVGGVGYFDASKSTYTFMKIPELAPWSVSSLLVDDQTLWIGLVGHPEGRDYGGGLLRHDLKTGTTMKFSIDEVILRIKRLNGRTYLATGSSVAIVDGDRIVARYMAEPDLLGKFVLAEMKP